MNHPNSSYCNRTSNPWSSQARNEPGPSSDVEPERRAHFDTLSLLGTSTGQINRDTRGTSNDHGDLVAHRASDPDEGQIVRTSHEQCFQSSISFNNQSSLYNAHGVSDSMDMSYWFPVAYTSDQSSSRNLAPQLFQNNTWSSVLPLSLDTHPSELHFLRQPSRSDAVYTEELGRESWTVVQAINDNDDTVIRIGSVLSNGKYACNDKSCAGQTFARPSELRRHHTALHAAKKPNFWCHVPTCPRSVNGGGESFHRRDNLTAHVKSMHS